MRSYVQRITESRGARFDGVGLVAGAEATVELEADASLDGFVLAPSRVDSEFELADSEHGRLPAAPATRTIRRGACPARAQSSAYTAAVSFGGAK